MKVRPPTELERLAVFFGSMILTRALVALVERLKRPKTPEWVSIGYTTESPGFSTYAEGGVIRPWTDDERADYYRRQYGAANPEAN